MVEIDGNLLISALSFFKKMVERLIEKENDGWCGWDEPNVKEFKARAISNIRNGDYVDAANLSMMLHCSQKVSRSEVKS